MMSFPLLHKMSEGCIIWILIHTFTKLKREYGRVYSAECSGIFIDTGKNIGKALVTNK